MKKLYALAAAPLYRSVSAVAQTCIVPSRCLVCSVILWLHVAGSFRAGRHLRLLYRRVTLFCYSVSVSGGLGSFLNGCLGRDESVPSAVNVGHGRSVGLYLSDTTLPAVCLTGDNAPAVRPIRLVDYSLQILARSAHVAGNFRLGRSQ